MTRNRIATALGMVLLAACGGGELLALLPIVGPIGGLWTKDAEPNSPTLQTTNGEFLNQMGPSDASFDTYPLQPNYEVTGTFGSATGPCAAGPNRIAVDVRGTVTADVANGDLLVLNLDEDPPPNPPVECLRGRIIDLRTIEVNPATRYRNTTPQFVLDRHEWVNANDTTQRFKFTIVDDATDDVVVDIAGCRLTNGAAQADFTAQLQGYNTAENAGPRIADFTVAGTNFGIGEFKSLREIEFGRSGGPRLLLQRVAAGATQTVCAVP